MVGAEGEKRGASIGLQLLALLWLVPALFFTPWLLYGVWPKLPVPSSHGLVVWWTLSGLLIVALGWVLLRRHTPPVGTIASWLFAQHDTAAGVLLSIGLVLTLLCTFELTFWGLRAHQEGKDATELKYITEGGLWADDPVYGYVSTGPGIIRQRCYLTDPRLVLYEKEYTLGPNGYRFTPQAEGPKEDYLALVGCSVTFGLGANDDETIAAQLAAMRPQTHVYNFGFPSWGPAQLLLQMRNGDVLDEIQEARGAVIYTFIMDHMWRIMPQMPLRHWTRNYPAFQLDAAGKPEYIGRMEAAYPWRNWIYGLLGQERFVQWSRITIPARSSPEDFALCAALIEAAREEYCTRFPEGEFYVLLDPFALSFPDSQLLINELVRRRIPVLRPRGLYGDDPRQCLYPRDLHPMPFAQELSARWIWDQFPNGPAEPPLGEVLGGRRN